MRMTCAARYAAVALSLCAALCFAAPRVDIRIIPRPQPEPPASGLTGPVPIRVPADPTGPFAYASIPCISNSNIELDGQSVWIDLCHLKNVTFVEMPTAISNAQSTTEDASSSSGSAADDTSSSEVAAPVPTRKILGIFRGWKIDPIHKKYKYAVFDDGDLCGDSGERYSVTVELVRSAQIDATPRIYDIRKVSSWCAFAFRVELFVPEYELTASNGIHTTGVLDISDAQEMLPQICGEMKCQYTHVASKVDVVKQEIQAVKESLEQLVTNDASSVSALTLTAAASIIKSSTDIMEKALELLQTIEQLEEQAQDARAVAAAGAVVNEHVEVVATS